jgi:hypothetical protein
MITPLPNAWTQKPGSATLPFFGVVPVLLDEKGHEVKGEGEGYLCIKQVRAQHSMRLYLPGRAQPGAQTARHAAVCSLPFSSGYKRGSTFLSVLSG